MSKPDEDVEVVYETTTWWEDFRDFYLSFDRRTLGITRIFIGLFLVFDLFRRTPDWFHMFANDGVLPAHYNLWRPQANGYSLFNAFANHGELIALWLLGLGIYLCILVGYKTRIAQVLAVFYVASMNGRVLLIENGGYVVHNLLMLWTAFLPLGDRFSLDALLASMKTQRERGDIDLNDRSTDVARWRLAPHVSLVSLVILLQLCAIYFFNVIHKTGPAWHNGTAVHFVLYVDRMITPLIAAVRDYIPSFGIIILTKWVMGMEAGMSLALLSPLARVWAKRIAILFVNLLHIGFGSTFVLGPFAWALCCFSILLFSSEDWEVAHGTMRRVHRRRTVRYDAASPVAFWACRMLKRLDRFELLTFEAAPVTGIVAVTPRGEKKTGAAGAADIIAALPLGPGPALLMRLPGAGLLIEAGAFVARLFVGSRSRSLGDQAEVPQSYRELPRPLPPTPVGYRFEPRDDGVNPKMDGAYARQWLREYYADRWLKHARFIIGAVLVFLGLFSALYVEGFATRHFEINMREKVFASWSREDLAFWGGLAAAALGALMVLKPLLQMVLTTPSSPVRKWSRVVAGLREALVFAMAIGAVNQGLVELWVFRDLRVPQPNAVRYLAHKLRYLQGWFMFSPNPVMDDGVIIVDAVTVDGRRVDPFSIEWPNNSLRPPAYDLLSYGSYEYNQIWSDYFNRMHMPGNTSFRKPMKEFIFRLPERTGNPNDAIVHGAVYWVHDMNPKFPRSGKREIKSYGYGVEELFKFTNDDKAVQARFRELTGGEDPPEAPLPVDVPREKSTGGE